MPAISVVFYQEAKGSSEVVTWLSQVRKEYPKAYAKCATRIQRLAALGHELRRPEADILRDDIYELRASFNGVHYRLLYFFHGRTVAVVSSGITKEAEVPNVDINRAIEKRSAFLKDPAAHTFTEQQE
jgi:hypothetical protein